MVFIFDNASKISSSIPVAVSTRFLNVFKPCLACSIGTAVIYSSFKKRENDQVFHTDCGEKRV